MTVSVCVPVWNSAEFVEETPLVFSHVRHVIWWGIITYFINVQ